MDPWPQVQDLIKCFPDEDEHLQKFDMDTVMMHSYMQIISFCLSHSAGRALHHGHQLLDQHVLRMPMASKVGELLQMPILIWEAVH